jgi:hypothetical protein
MPVYAYNTPYIYYQFLLISGYLMDLNMNLGHSCVFCLHQICHIYGLYKYTLYTYAIYFWKYTVGDTLRYTVCLWLFIGLCQNVSNTQINMYSRAHNLFKTAYN